VAASPERQCVGCGRRGPQNELVRLCIEERETSTSGFTRVVVAGRGLGGRGAYLCRRQACLDRALHRKAFHRAFRVAVAVDVEQIRAAMRTVEGGE